MSAIGLEDIFDPGAGVLGSSQSDKGVILVQTGDPVTSEVLSDEAEWWQHVGFASRPARPVPGKNAAQVIAITSGTNDIAIASRDTRCALPAGLGPGETVVYAGGPQNAGTGQVRLEDNGSRALITISAKKGNGSAGQVVSMKVESSGAITIDVGGSNKISVDDTGIKLGANATIPVALATPLATWISQLLVSLASGSNSGGPVVWAVPLPSTPSFASSVVKGQL